MLNVLSITFPIFAIILLGYLATRANVVAKTDIRGLGAFVIKFGLPALIFRSLAERPIGEIFNPSFLMVYGVASVSTFLLIFFSARVVAGRDLRAGAVQALGASTSNSGFIGYPVAFLVLGPPAVIALALAMLIENIVMISAWSGLGRKRRQRGKEAGRGGACRRHAPRAQSIDYRDRRGNGIFTLRTQTADAIFRVVDMLAMASAAVALFAVGGTLVGLKVRGMFADVGRIVFGKLFLHPAAVVLALFLAPGIDSNLAKAALIFASVPTFSVFPLLGQPYGQETVAAAALMVATILSFLTISTLLLCL